MKIIALAGSNSSTSINYQLVNYAISKMDGIETQLLNMSNFSFPIYSEDIEKEKGFPEEIITLKDQFQSADGFVIAVNEHNGNLSAYFKNTLDWLSRVDRNFLKDKKGLLLSTSPGGGGGKNALAVVKNMLPHMGATIIDTFSLPSFYDNFDIENKEIKNQEVVLTIETIITNFQKEL